MPTDSASASPTRENFTWKLAPHLELTLGVTTLELPDGTLLAPTRQEMAPGASGGSNRKWTCHYTGGYEVAHEATASAGGILLSTSLLSRAEDATFARIHVSKGLRLASSETFDHIYWHTAAMDGFSGVIARPGEFTSWGQVGITDADGERAALAGFLDFSSYDGRIAGAPDGANAWLLNPSCGLVGRKFEPGRAVPIPALQISFGPSLAALFSAYGAAVGKKMKARTTAPAHIGWCSWYGYYGHENEGDLLENLDLLARSFPPGQKPVFQIDDGWNLPQPGHPRVWGDWTPGAKFSGGMAPMAKQIRDRNFIPGLWLAPFSVDRASRLFAEHPDWLVQEPGEAGQPSQPALAPGEKNVFGLDLTQPRVLAFLRETFRRVFHEWNYDYDKIDFLGHGLIPGRRWNNEQTPIEAFRAGMAVIREEAGDARFILACGCPFGPAIGYCDGMRVGLDTGGGWNPPFTLPQWPNGNCSVHAAALPAFYRQWMHRNLWVNDPDCVIARQAPCTWEVEEFGKAIVHFQPVPKPSTFFLNDEEAGFSVRLIWMLGGASISSDIWAQLSPERLALLKAAFPPNPRPTMWIDWYHDHEVCLLRTTEGPLSVGLFNHSDRAAKIALPTAKLGLKSWKFTERFSGESFSGAGETVAFPELPPHAARVWEIGK
jgi:alpha-galactosidase